MIRLGDGTEESHNKVQASLNNLWKYMDEMFFMNEVDQELIAEGIAINLEDLRDKYNDKVNQVLELATLSLPQNKWKQTGGRTGRHSEHFGHLIAEMQYMQRAYPNQEW